MTQERFERGAATWDENPGRIQNAQHIASAIRKAAHIDGSSVIVDYGCGTGLVTLDIARSAGRVVGVDSSPAMLGVLTEKAKGLGMTNVEALCHDLAESELTGILADLVVSAMVMHHIEDVGTAVMRLANLVKPGGSLVIADLDEENGSFHSDMTGVVHCGFRREDMTQWFSAAGLIDLTVDTANVIVREGPDGPRNYSIFCMRGRKPV